MADSQTTINNLKTRIHDLTLMLDVINHETAWYEYHVNSMAVNTTYTLKERIWYTRSALMCKQEAQFNVQEIAYLEGQLVEAENDRYLYYFWDERIA